MGPRWSACQNYCGQMPLRVSRVGPMSIRIQCLCVDTTDPAGLASFWEAALGWRRTYAKDEEVVLEPPEGSWEDGMVPDLLFLRVPDSRASGFPHPTASGCQPEHAGLRQVLVMCKNACFSFGSFDAGEDLLGVLGPGERARVVVPGVDERADGLGELAD